MEKKKYLTITNFTKELGRVKTGTIHVKAIDLINLIKDPRPNSPDFGLFNTKAPIIISPKVQRSIILDTSNSSEPFLYIQCGRYHYGELNIAYVEDLKEYHLIDGQHRFYRLFEVLKDISHVPNDYSWNGVLLPRITFKNLPSDLKQKLENMEVSLNFIRCKSKDIGEMFILLNKRQKKATASAIFNAEHADDQEYQKCKDRASQSYTKIFSETEKTARYLYEINKYLANNNATPKNIIVYNNSMDSNVESLYRQIKKKNKPVKNDTDFIGFIYFYAMACIYGKEKKVSRHIDDIRKFFNDADDFTKHINKITPHREIINYSNIKATTDPQQWEKKGEYLYNYMHAKFPQDF